MLSHYFPSATRKYKIRIYPYFPLEFSAACWWSLVPVLEETVNCSKQTLLKEI